MNMSLSCFNYDRHLHESQALFLTFLFSCLFPFDLRVNIKPDSLYVGSLVEITVSVENIKDSDVPVFYDLEELDEHQEIHLKEEKK